jgi:hypothetical protein
MDTKTSGSCDHEMMPFSEIECIMSSREPDDKTMVFKTFLKDQSFSYFKHKLKERLDAEVYRAL